jgi:plasmid stabilization system protein ParE
MKIKILSSASQDLIDGYFFYDKQTESVGSYFLDSLYSDIDSLVITAGVHQKYFENYYRLLSKRFPFAVYYKVENDFANVYAVLDTRRKPAWIRNKLQTRR